MGNPSEAQQSFLGKVHLNIFCREGLVLFLTLRASAGLE